MDSVKAHKVGAIVPAAMLLFIMLLLMASCTDDGKKRTVENPPDRETEMVEETTSGTTTALETTGPSQPPEVTLGNDGGGEPEVTIRLEGDPSTTFSGLCSLGAGQKVLSGQVPKRFEFDLKGRQLSCRIEKRDNNKGDLKVVLIVGDATRSVQQTNEPDGVINVSYGG